MLSRPLTKPERSWSAFAKSARKLARMTWQCAFAGHIPVQWALLTVASHPCFSVHSKIQAWWRGRKAGSAAKVLARLKRKKEAKQAVQSKRDDEQRAKLGCAGVLVVRISVCAAHLACAAQVQVQETHGRG